MHMRGGAGRGSGWACVLGVLGFDAGTNANSNKKVICWSKFTMRTLLVSLSSSSQEMRHGFSENIWQSMQSMIQVLGP